MESPPRALTCWLQGGHFSVERQSAHSWETKVVIPGFTNFLPRQTDNVMPRPGPDLVIQVVVDLVLVILCHCIQRFTFHHIVMYIVGRARPAGRTWDHRETKMLPCSAVPCWTRRGRRKEVTLLTSEVMGPSFYYHSLLLEVKFSRSAIV